MEQYIINKNEDDKGNNEIHMISCNHLPDIKNQVFIGQYDNKISALVNAKLRGWKNADGCFYCCEEIHVG